ncbi:MAG: hydantoinase/oxoprolinase family protein, partial [Nocardioides sp.]|nr:hydantoinase/oxoprolinase family protein [Nocardioides sp.]
MILGVDVGGTFTDLVAWDGRTVVTGKVSTSVDQSEAVVAGAKSVSGDAAPAALLHGSTIATNALLERKGARTALVTDPGFEDVLEIGRQDRPSLYDPDADRPQPLVPAQLRLPRDDLDGLITALTTADVEAVAVALLYSFRHPSAERELGRLLAQRLPGLAISLSSRVAPEFREFERVSTTVLNAYLMPVVDAYTRRLADRLTHAELSGDVQVMHSSGGLMPLSRAGLLPAATLLSGPAGGVVAAAALGTAMGYRHLISFDMGGTSTDVSRVDDGRPAVAYQRSIEGYACRFPAVAVHTVGAGGGSLGWADPGGALRVGPRSAGAHPGPACYGRGGEEATVTDANLLLGRLDPDGALAG